MQVSVRSLVVEKVGGTLRHLSLKYPIATDIQALSELLQGDFTGSDISKKIASTSKPATSCKLLIKKWLMVHFRSLTRFFFVYIFSITNKSGLCWSNFVT